MGHERDLVLEAHPRVGMPKWPGSGHGRRRTAQPKAGDGPIEMLRTLQAARRSAMKARTQAGNQLHALVVTGPG